MSSLEDRQRAKIDERMESFLSSLKDIDAERNQAHPKLEQDLRSLAEATNTADQVNLDTIRISEIKNRLQDTAARQRIEIHDEARALGARYLHEASTHTDTPELKAVAAHLGEASTAPLTKEERERAERFLLGEKIYERRSGRLHGKFGDTIPEASRKEILKNVFAALARTGFREQDENARWRDKIGPVQELQERVLENIAFSSRMPVRELARFMAEKGSEDFLYRSPVGLSEKPLAEVLDLDEYKTRIEAIPANASPTERTKTYLEIVNAISVKLAKDFPYKSVSKDLQSMSEGSANCAGYALLGCLALKELDIPYAFIGATRHAFVGFETPDGSFYINHFQGTLSERLMDSELDRMHVSDLIEFMHDRTRSNMLVRLSVDSSVQWWTKNEGSELSHHEMMYLNKEIEPALVSWIRSREEIDVSPEMYMHPRDIIDPNLALQSGRKGLVEAIRRSPEDTSALELLAANDKEAFGGFWEKNSVTYRWSELLGKATSAKQSKGSGLWSRVQSLFRKR